MICFRSQYDFCSLCGILFPFLAVITVLVAGVYFYRWPFLPFSSSWESIAAVVRDRSSRPPGSLSLPSVTTAVLVPLGVYSCCRSRPPFSSSWESIAVVGHDRRSRPPGSLSLPSVATAVINSPPGSISLLSVATANLVFLEVYSCCRSRPPFSSSWESIAAFGHDRRSRLPF
jgi:hypothetical protein